MAYKDHSMYKGKAHVTTRNKKAHEVLEEQGWGHSSPFNKAFKKKRKKNPCWKGYEMIGMKTKGGRKVPNCVPKKK